MSNAIIIEIKPFSVNSEYLCSLLVFCRFLVGFLGGFLGGFLVGFLGGSLSGHRSFYEQRKIACYYR